MTLANQGAIIEMKAIKQVQNILIKIQKLREKINDIQDSCPHQNKNKKYKSNTGNYDPSCDSYWIDIDCLDCGKHWCEDQ